MMVFNNFRPRSASATWWSSSRLWSGFGRWTTSTLTSPSSLHWTQRQSGDLVNISSCIHLLHIIWRQRGKNHRRLACRVLFVQRSWTKHPGHHPHVQSGKRRSRTGWQNIAPSSTRLLHSERTGKHQSCCGHQANTSVHSAFYLALVKSASSSFFKRESRLTGLLAGSHLQRPPHLVSHTSASSSRWG